jgi:bifunctional non-homologous end joining protein LigD
MEQQHSSLYFSEGSSDKEYHVHLTQAESNNLWLVNFEYGRRGSALKSGTKTDEPLSYEKAKSVFDKLVNSKTKDGYTESASGTPFQSPQLEARFTGCLPHLLSPVSCIDAKFLISDDRYVAQEKFDGDRRMARKRISNNYSEGINRNGLSVSLPLPLNESILLFEKPLFFDGELIGDHLVVFDLLEFNSIDLRNLPFSDRHDQLISIFNSLDKKTSRSLKVSFAPLAKTTAEKQALFDAIEARGGEGIVFKDKNAPYTPGLNNSSGSQKKFKFIDSATVEVTEKHESKRSVFIAAYDETGSRVPLGKVTIPSNQEIPTVGMIIEVQYLYAYPNGSLFQPVYKGVRNDQFSANCLTSQLKYKSEAVLPSNKKKANK